MRIVRHRLRHDDDTKVPFRSTPNCGGELEPRYLLMHYTAGASADQSVAWLTNRNARASAHVVIARDGSVTQLVPFDTVAWHAGRSAWQGREGLNRFSIGIELDNLGKLHREGVGWCAWFGAACPPEQVVEAVHPHESAAAGWQAYTTEQIQAAVEVALALVRKYDLKDVLGHEDVSPGRKTDPGPAFPMGSFRARVLGRDADRPPIFEVLTALNIRTGAGTVHDRLPAGPLPPGTRVQPIRTSGTWWLVDVLEAEDGPADLQGWVHSRFLREV